VCDQTFTDWEIVVVDDGSKEDLSHLEHEFPQVKFIKNERQSGAAFSRNVGIDNTSGDLIAFLDCDDVWRTTKLMSQVEAIETDQAIALCYTDYEVMDRSGCVVGSSQQSASFGVINTFCAGRDSFRALAKVHIATASCVMVRRSAVPEPGLFDASLSCCEDFDAWLNLCTKYKSVYLNSVEVAYRTHPGQMTRSENYIWSSDNEKVWGKYIDLANENQDPELAQAARTMQLRARRNYCALAYENARAAWKGGDFAVMCKFLSRSLMLDRQFALAQMRLWLSVRAPGRVQAGNK